MCQRLFLLVVVALFGRCRGDTPADQASQLINISWTHLVEFSEPDPRRAASLVSLGGKVVLFGGDQWVYDDGEASLRPVDDSQKLWSFDTESKMWDSLANKSTTSPSVRAGHAAVARSTDPQNTMLVHGGEEGENADQFSDELWLYELGSNSWKLLSSNCAGGKCPSARSYHSLTAVPSSSVESYIVYGGQLCNNNSCPPSNEVWRLQLSNGAKADLEWAQLTSVGTSAPALYAHGAAYLGQSEAGGLALGVHVFGGVLADGSVSANTTVIQPSTSEKTYAWAVVSAPTSEPRCHHSVFVTAGKVIVFGGYNSAGNLTNMSAEASLLTYTPNGAAFDVDNFVSTDPSYQALLARGYQSGAVMSGSIVDTLVIFGGNMNDLAYAYGDLWIYHNASIEQIYGSLVPDHKFTQISGARANGAAYCANAIEDSKLAAGSSIVCPATNANLITIGGTIQTQEQDEISHNYPQVGTAGAFGATLDDNSITESAGNFLTDKDSLAYFSYVRMHNGSRIVFGGLYYPEVLAPLQAPQSSLPQSTMASSAVYISGNEGDAWTSLPTILPDQPDPSKPSYKDEDLERFMHCAVSYVEKGVPMMLVWGGVRINSASTFTQWPLFLKLNLNTRKWTVIDSDNGPVNSKFGHSCVIVYPNLILFGGASTTDTTYKVPDKWGPSADLWQFNVEASRWIQLRSAGVQPYPTMMHTATLMYNDTRMVVVGGLVKQPHGGSDAEVPSNQVVVVDLSVNCLDATGNEQCWWLQIHTPGIINKYSIMNGRYGHNTLPIQNTDDNRRDLLISGGIDDEGKVATDLWRLTLTVIDTHTPLPPSGSSTILGLTWTQFTLVLVACILSLGGLALSWRYYRRRQRYLKTQRLLADLNRKSGTQGRLLAQPEDEENILAIEHQSGWEEDFALYLADAQDFVIDFDILRIVKQIGHGATSVVHVGWWDNRPVAIKRFFLNQSFQFKDFCRETLVHRNLTHQNVLELHAITVNPPCSITPLMRYGSLFHLLQSSQDLPYLVVLQLAQDAACGMNYLHSQGVLHRDLKTLNLLIDDNWCVKVADFGTSRFQVSAMTTGIGSVQYMAPEVFVSNYCTTKADVYSFAIILWEMITRKVPYGDVSSPFIVCCDVRNGLRLEIPAETTINYKELIENCWNQDANERPSFQEILDQLKEMIDLAKQEQQLDPSELKGERTLRASFKKSFQDLTDLKKFMASPTHTGSNTDGASSYEGLSDPLNMSSSRSPDVDIMRISHDFNDASATHSGSSCVEQESIKLARSKP